MSTITLFVDQLTVIDFAYFHAQRGIVGESWIMDVELTGELDEQGMIFDFAHVKKQIKALTDELIDHKFAVPQHNPGVSIYEHQGQVVFNAKTENDLHYRHTSPSQAIVKIPASDITIATVVPFLVEKIKAILPSNVANLIIHLREEAIDGAYYHYAHGLKKHFGDCQRIAHGHRSKIQVFRNAQRDKTLEQFISDKWQDIYLITEEDIQEELEIEGKPYYKLGYEANQGKFELIVPKSVCDLLETDSTVELIAEHLLALISDQVRTDKVTLKAYEGVQKGAIAHR